MTGSLMSHARRAAGCLAIVGLAAWPDWVLAQTATPAVKPARLTVVRSVSRTPLPRGERITIELSDEVSYVSERIPNPDRVYFDFKMATVPSTVVGAVHALGASPLIPAIRIARHSDEVTRLVLALGGNARHSAFPMYAPFRLVIDVEGPAPAADRGQPADRGQTGVRPGSDLGQTGVKPESDPGLTPTPPTPAPTPPTPAVLAVASAAHVPPSPTLPPPLPPSALPRGDYSLARQLGLGVARIVIDAGHGGHDPGAQSNGLREADLVLDVALRVEKLLKDVPGVDVVLTRRTDEFIALEERTAIANREGADLFLSIHANASRQTSAHGLETYFLNFATNPAAEAVAARENATSGRTMGNLPELVRTIALNSKVVESRELATIVQTSMVRRLRLQNKGVRDLGVKQAPFVVLIGAQMPSVLAEIAFVTNRAEANFLKQQAYRQRIAQSLADAVVKYQASLKKVATVAVKAQER